MEKVKVVVLNAARMNFDGALDLSVLSPDLVVYDSTEPDQILERIKDADVVVTKEMPVDAQTILNFPASVRLICEAGTGYNNLDLEAARKKNIAVCNVPAYSTQRVAHTAIMMMLNLSSSMQIQQAMLTRGDRSNFTDALHVQHVELNQKTLGIIGAGAIGRAVIRIARAMEMNVLVYTRTPRQDQEGVTYVDLERLLKESDYVSLHCPLTPQTRHIIDEKALRLMKPTAFLINTARGALVDEPALLDALKAGRIAGAGLDVQETEPPADDSPLYTLPNVVLTPHMGWKGYETRQRLVSILADNIRSFFSGQAKNIVS